MRLVVDSNVVFAALIAQNYSLDLQQTKNNRENMLYNRTQNKKIAEKTRLANTFFEKFKGLMFEKKERFDYALIFDFGSEKKAGASIHMLFVFFPICAVYLDRKKKVVDIRSELKPFALNYTPKKPGRYLIELPCGQSKEIQLSDELEW